MKDEIEVLYDVFSRYPIKDLIEGCPCCVSSKREKPLHSKDLRQLSWGDLQIFIFKAMTTFGDESDLKHFLPRIFELYITDYYCAPYDIGVLLSKLKYAKWKEWPSKESKAIEMLILRWEQYLIAKCEVEILEEIKQDMLVYEFSMP